MGACMLEVRALQVRLDEFADRVSSLRGYL